MADSIRELIVKNIQTTLQAIPSIESVQRLRQSGMKKAVIPVVWIEEGQETAIDLQGVVERELVLALALINRHDEDEDLLSSAEIMSPLRDDIERELMKDRTRGGNANETTSITSWNVVQVMDRESDLIQVGLFSVQYYTSPTDPSVKIF